MFSGHTIYSTIDNVISIIPKRMIVNSTFYIRQYPDVAAANIDPVEHYIMHGRYEGRAPNCTLLKIYRFCAPQKFGFSGRQGLAEFYASKGTYRQLNRYFLYERWIARLIGKRLFVRCLPVQQMNNTREIKKCLIEPGGKYEVAEPRVIGQNILPVSNVIDLPEKVVYTIKKAHVIGSLQVLHKNKFLLIEPAGDPTTGFVAGSWLYVTGIQDSAQKVAIYYNFNNIYKLPEAILLGGRCSINYFHWLIEYLGRLYIISKLPELWSLPVIVDAGMYPQQFEVLELLWPGKVYKRDVKTLLKVDVLHIPTLSTFHPDDPNIPFWKGSAVCHNTLGFLREKVFERLGISQTQFNHRKIFICRRNARNVLNTEEVETALSGLGFEIIEPGSLTFREQVKLFNEASIIVGPMGAAFTNIIFCQPGTKIISLASPYAKKFCMQSNLARFSGCDYCIFEGQTNGYVPGSEDTSLTLEKMHSSFSIDIISLTQYLQSHLKHPSTAL